MLQLTRKAHQGIYIGENIYIKIIEIRDHQVRIGFEAPPHINIVREEIKYRDDDFNSCRYQELIIDLTQD